jgi:pimeloyl-ACP methyl ester carboxylesterase
MHEGRNTVILRNLTPILRRRPQKGHIPTRKGRNGQGGLRSEARDMQDGLSERITTAELVVYAGVGHTPRWQDPSRFAADVSAFVSGSLRGPGWRR